MRVLVFAGGVCYVQKEMFNKDSPTRCLLRSRGIDFKSDEEVVQWVAAKDIPGAAYITCDVADVPQDYEGRLAWMKSVQAQLPKTEVTA